MKEGTLISPIPKEYLTYSNKEKIEKTENYYQKINELYRRMDASREEYRKRIDRLMVQSATYDELFEVLQEKEAQILCLYDYDFFVLKLMCQIAEKEGALQETPTLNRVNSMQDAINLQQKCVFLLRRFEFGWEEDEELLLMVQEKKVSYVCLAELVCGEGIVRKVHTAGKVAYYLYVNGLIREALLFLMWIEKQLPYSERKIMLFSMTLLDLGERQLAYQILMKHQNPNQDVEELQMALSQML